MLGPIWNFSPDNAGGGTSAFDWESPALSALLVDGCCDGAKPPGGSIPGSEPRSGLDGGGVARAGSVPTPSVTIAEVRVDISWSGPGGRPRYSCCPCR